MENNLNNTKGKFVKLGFIYCLVNPTNNEIFYVGATESAPKDRLQGHYNHFKEYLKGQRKGNNRFEYFEKLWPEIARVRLIKIVQNDYLYEWEKYYINKYRKLGCPLTNQTDGGEGGDTQKYKNPIDKQAFSELIRNKIAYRKKPEGFAENLSKSRMGKDNPMAGKSILGWVIVFDNSDNPLTLCKYPYEITEFLQKMYPNYEHKKCTNATGNISKGVRHNKSHICKSLGYIFKAYEICDKKIQDIVSKTYENKSL